MLMINHGRKKGGEKKQGFATYHIFSCKERNFKTSFGGPNSGFAHYKRHTFGMMKIFIFSISVVLSVVVRNLRFCILFIK